MRSDLGTSGKTIDHQSIVKERVNNISEIENIIHNDFMDRRSANDKVIDLQYTELGYKIATVERDNKQYQVLLDENNKIILNNRTNIQTEIIGNDEKFFAASYQIYSKGEETRSRYIKDIKNDKIITETFEAKHINNIKHHEKSNLYLIEMSDDSIINGYMHVQLLDEKGQKIDEGGIEMLENDLYVKKIWRWYDHERVADVYYNQIEKDDNNYKIKTLFQGLQTPSDYEQHKDNYFQYMGDGMIIQSAPRGGKNVPTPCHIYNGEFGQATDIFSPEKKQSPEYTGKLFFISKKIFGVRPQVFPRGNNIYEPRSKKFRSPYMNFVNFDGEIITKKPYYSIKKVGNIFFAKPVKENMINIASNMDKTINSPTSQETEIDKQYIENKKIEKGNDEWIIINQETFDPVDKNESFVYIKENELYIECIKENEEIVIYDKNGNRKADIKSYKTLQDEIYECTSISGERIYFDNQWNKIDF